ncbi:TPA: hypothetical protein HA246_03550 [Candidatus Woesearchaeota archaeon]|nr:hypothetical protein [Candidatus Woesearchaeota archaeon]
MATITTNVKEDVAQTFRKRAIEIYGKRKGVLGKAMSEAMMEWCRKKEYFETCMKLLDEGIDTGKLKYKKRDELYDRN